VDVVKPLLLIGGGGHCLSAIGVVNSFAQISPDPWQPIVIQHSEDPRPPGPAIVTIGQIMDSLPRERVFTELVQECREIPVIYALSAIVVGNIGRGTMIFHHAVVNKATIGDNCIINTGAIVEHGSMVGNHCHVSTGAIVNGDCWVGMRCFIGSHATIIQGVKICEGCVIGAGAVVHKDITEPGTYVGVPARRVA
jgi:sugar O-acyltransferase (sialic acid O-acetyltransferase NeuD family)